MTTRRKNNTTIPPRFFGAIKKDINTEQEQAFVRMFLGAGVLLYLLLAGSLYTRYGIVPVHAMWLAVGFVIYAGIMIAVVFTAGRVSIARRAITMILDFAFFSYGMFILSDLGPVFYVALLCSVPGYGIRYGKKYLPGAGALAVCGFLLVMSAGPPWLNSPVLAASLLAGLFILPVFVYALLESIEKERARADMADLEKEQFAATLGHEMRTPLNSIIGMGDILATTELDDDQRGFSGSIQLSALALQEIVDDVTHEAGIVPGKRSLNKTGGRLQGYDKSTTNMAGEQLHARNDSQAADTGRTGPDMKRGSPVTVPASNHSPGGTVLVVSRNSETCKKLADYLAGWNRGAAYASNASEAFSRLIDAGHAGHPFNHVILDQPAIDIDAIEFVHAIEGEDSVQKPRITVIHPRNGDLPKLAGYGHVTILPGLVDGVALYKALHAGTHRAPGKQGGRVKHDKDPLCLLVAEDNKVSQRVIERIAEKLGHVAHIVNNGEHALRQLLENSYDLAILDLHLPDMSGVELIRSYRDRAAGKTIPVIMLTANITPEAKEACRDAGASAFLTKPVTSQLLSNVITTILGSNAGNNHNNSLPAKSGNVLDNNALAELVSLDSGNGFLSRLCSSFEEDVESLLENIRAETGNGDIAYIRELLHALKGSAGNVGASELLHCCTHYSNMSDREFRENYHHLLPELNEKFNEARHALREYIEEQNAIAG